MLGEIEATAQVEKARESGQQWNLSEHEQVHVALEEIDNDIRPIRRDGAEPRERDHRRSPGYNDDEKTERSEVALPLSLNVIQGDGPRTYKQHLNQG